MIDIEATIRAYLVTLTDLTAIFGTRIYAARSLPPGYRAEQGAALLMTIRGGGQEYHSQLYLPSVQLRAYAATEEEVRAASMAIYDALNDTKARGFAWIRMEDGTLPVLLNEPGTNWPYMLSYYSIQVLNL
jgi:hypothetical protein